MEQVIKKEGVGTKEERNPAVFTNPGDTGDITVKEAVFLDYLDMKNEIDNTDVQQKVKMMAHLLMEGRLFHFIRALETSRWQRLMSSQGADSLILL